MTDKQKELLAKYSRVAEDKSQLQKFTKDVITGEIGGGGSSGPVLYKHNVSLYLTFDNPDDTLVTLNFLSKYDNFNATSLLGLLQTMRSLGDTQVMLNPIIDDNNGNVFFVSNVATSSNGTALEFIVTIATNNAALSARFEGANENITDIVEPYIEASGGGSTGGSIIKVAGSITVLPTDYFDGTGESTDLISNATLQAQMDALMTSLIGKKFVSIQQVDSNAVLQPTMISTSEGNGTWAISGEMVFAGIKIPIEMSKDLEDEVYYYRFGASLPLGTETRTQGLPGTYTIYYINEEASGGSSGGQIKTINLNNYTTDQILFILLDPIIKFDETGNTISQIVNIQGLPIDWENDDVVKLVYTVSGISGEMIMRKAVSLNGLKSYQCSSSYISRSYGICLVSMCLATPYDDLSSFEVLMVSITPLPNMPE